MLSSCLCQLVNVGNNTGIIISTLVHLKTNILHVGYNFVERFQRRETRDKIDEEIMNEAEYYNIVAYVSLSLGNSHQGLAVTVSVSFFRYSYSLRFPHFTLLQLELLVFSITVGISVPGRINFSITAMYIFYIVIHFSRGQLQCNPKQ